MVKETKRKQQPASSNMSGIIFDKDSAGIATKEWRRAKALFSYSPKHDDELQLEVGDVIEVMEEVEEGWWRGILKGVIGVFPSNFVAELKDSASPKEIKKSSVDSGFNTPTNQDVPPGQKNVDTTDGNAESHAKKKIQIPKKAPPPPPPLPVWNNDAPTIPPRPVREMAVVMHPYTPENDDELALKEGDIITIITKDVVDVGWWKGEINGQVGVFPDNFVQLLPVQEPPRRKRMLLPLCQLGICCCQVLVEQLTLQNLLCPPTKKPPRTKEESGGKFYNVPSAPTETKLPPPSTSSKASTEPPTKKVPSEDKSESQVRPPLPPHKKPSPAKKPERLSFPSVQSIGGGTPTTFHLSAAATAPSVTVPPPSQEESLDAVTSSCEQLPHLSRTKGPSRRPPTSLRNSSEPNGQLEEMVPHSPVSPAMPTIPPPPVPHSGVRVLPELPKPRPEPPATDHHKDQPTQPEPVEVSSSSLTQEVPTLPKKMSKSPLIQKRVPPAPAAIAPEVPVVQPTFITPSEPAPQKEELAVPQKCGDSVATSTSHECESCSKNFKVLQQQLEAVQSELTNHKVAYKKQILDLMAELDEEKKIRLDLQVQLDRIKKLMTTV